MMEDCRGGEVFSWQVEITERFSHVREMGVGVRLMLRDLEDDVIFAPGKTRTKGKGKRRVGVRSGWVRTRGERGGWTV